MPRKPRATKVRRLPIGDDVRHFLFTGECDAEDFDLFLLRVKPERLRRIWMENKEELLDEWIEAHPGTRPWAWWEFSAPRQADQGSGGYWEGTLPEPRRRLGGVGTPAADVLAYVPTYRFGIPDNWVSRWDELYYNGQAYDVHGKKIGNHNQGDFPGRAIDPSDLPRFESQATFLRRLGLLSEGELKALRDKREAWEPEAVR